MACRKRKLPKSINYPSTLDELEALETADWVHDVEERERKQSLKHKKAQNLAEGYAKRRPRKKK